MARMTLHCIYASTSGNVQATVEYVADWLRQKGVEVELHRAEQTPFQVVAENQQFLLATSTWEHGVLNPFFDKLAADFQINSLSGKKAGFIGLGDTRYEPVLFCGGMETLKNIWTKSGGEVKGNVLKINGEPFHQFESNVLPWLGRWWEEFNRV
jgi:flavodoxin